MKKIIAMIILCLAITNQAFAGESIDTIAMREASKYDLSYELVRAVILTESSDNEKAKNGVCLGLMQINSKNAAPWVAKEIGMSKCDLYTASDNIAIGCYYLDYLRTYWQEQGFDDEECFSLMLLSYNRGINGCKKWIAKNDNWLEEKYVKKVLNYKNEYEQGSR